MTITANEVYWVTRLDAFHMVFGISIALLTLMIIGSCIGIFSGFLGENYNSVRKCRWCAIFLMLLIVILSFFESFIPTTKEMIAIKVIPAINNSDFVQEKLPKEASELYDLAKKAIIKNIEGEKKAGEK